MIMMVMLTDGDDGNDDDGDGDADDDDDDDDDDNDDDDDGFQCDVITAPRAACVQRESRQTRSTTRTDTVQHATAPFEGTAIEAR